MLAACTDISPRRQLQALLAALSLVSCLAFAQQDSLDARIAQIREIGRFIPENALPMLLQLEAQGRAAAAPTKAEFLSQLSLVRLYAGQKDEALVVAEELLAFARTQHDDAVMAKALLTKAYVLFDMNQLAQSHQLAWSAERLANTTGDMALRVQATVSSGQSFAEEGDFPAALAKLQAAVALARGHGAPIPLVSALNALANLYGQMKEHERGFEALEEASTVAAKTKSPGRMASLKNTEYGLAVETNQLQRGLKALLAALALERQIGAHSMVATSLVNLSDSYLKQHDYAKALSYANQAIAAAQRTNNHATEATARVNLGEAYLGIGSIAEGKRSFEAGLAYYEQSGDKPQLQALMLEYGAALERVGDMAGAVVAYHRERRLSKELFEKRRQKAVWELQAKYEAEKAQRQIELLRGENLVKSTELDNRRLQQRIWWLLALVFALASSVVGLLYRKVRHANAQLEVKNLELKQQSSRDPLTGLYNRRHFQEFMRNHMQVEKRGSGTSGEEMVGALFLLDVDHFKHVNDTHGHAAGDAVLKMIAENLQVILRETDMIVRWGGEEFLAFLPAIPRSGLEEIARRLLTGISSHAIEHQNSKISVDVSIGFAPFPLAPAGQPLTWERAVNLIDMALYLAKAHGRNRAYGVRGFANFHETSMEDIEHDLERAWRAGFVDLAIVPGGWAEPGSGAASAKLSSV